MTDPARAALLMDLSDRVEKAEGADRELDGAIATALGWTEVHGSVMAPAFQGGRPPGVTDWWDHVPTFTASLDAALSLVPEGWAWAVYGGAREEIVATAYCVPNGGRLPWPDWVTDICAATPALALCAAALRALASGAPR